MQPEGPGTPAAFIVDEDVTVAGNIMSRGGVQVEGMVTGNIFCSSLTVGETGQVSGGIVAEDVIVHGRIAGSIHAARVTLGSTGHVEADICHRMLKIEPGGFFEGGSRSSDNPLLAAAQDDYSIIRTILSANAIPKSANAIPNAVTLSEAA